MKLGEIQLLFNTEFHMKALGPRALHFPCKEWHLKHNSIESVEPDKDGVDRMPIAELISYGGAVEAWLPRLKSYQNDAEQQKSGGFDCELDCTAGEWI